MAKIFGISGKIQGKIANQVYTIVKGVNLARAYNPSPANPQTAPQVAQRAKLKLISQVAAAFAPAIAFARVGLSSPRNQFTKGNIGAVTYDNTSEVASFDYANMDLTGGVVGLPAPEVTRNGQQLSIHLSAAVDNIDVVYYTAVIVQPNGAVRIIGPVSVPRGEGLVTFSYTMQGVPADAVGYIMAYGMRFNNDFARAKYESIQFVNDEVNVMVVRKVLADNVTFTETRSAEIPTT